MFHIYVVSYATHISRVGQNRIYTYKYTVYLVIFEPKIPYVNRIYMVLANPIYIHRIWPYNWWFPYQKYYIYTVYIWFWPTLHISPYWTSLKSVWNIPGCYHCNAKPKPECSSCTPEPRSAASLQQRVGTPSVPYYPACWPCLACQKRLPFQAAGAPQIVPAARVVCLHLRVENVNAST